MDESRLRELYPLLDRAVFERLPDGELHLATVPPAWLAELIGGRGERVALRVAMPYVDAFLGEAEAFWWQEREGLLWSEPFVASGPQGEHLLRAAAVTLWTSHLLVLERLTGSTDTRPLLQVAREAQFEHERLRGRVEALRKPAATLSAAANQLLATGLSADQRELADRVARAAERIIGLI